MPRVRGMWPSSEQTTFGKISRMMQNIQKGSGKTNRRETLQSDCSLKTKIRWTQKIVCVQLQQCFCVLGTKCTSLCQKWPEGPAASLKDFLCKQWVVASKKKKKEREREIHMKDFFKEFVQNICFATNSIPELYYLTRGL